VSAAEELAPYRLVPATGRLHHESCGIGSTAGGEVLTVARLRGWVARNPEQLRPRCCNPHPEAWLERRAEAAQLGERITAAVHSVQAFAAELRDQGLHVGLGSPAPRCVTCGEPWPCTTSEELEDEVRRGGAAEEER
jgi:hypothetical protein